MFDHFLVILVDQNLMGKKDREGEQIVDRQIDVSMNSVILASKQHGSKMVMVQKIRDRLPHWSAEYLLGAKIGFLILAFMTIKLMSNESWVFSEYENTIFHTLL